MELTLKPDECLIVYKEAKGMYEDKKLSLSLWAATRMAPNQEILLENGLAIHKMPERCLNGAKRTLDRYNIMYLLPKSYEEAHKLGAKNFYWNK